MVGNPSLGPCDLYRKQKFSSLLLIPFLILLTACAPRLRSSQDQSAQVESPAEQAISTRPPQVPTLTGTRILIAPTSTPEATDLPLPTATEVFTPTPTPQVCRESGSVNLGTFYSVAADMEVSFRIYLPPCYGEDGHRYPTLYMFHGSIQDDSHWDSLGLDEAADQAILSKKVAPFIIVMPDGGWLANNTSGGPGSFEALVTDDLIPYVETNYCTWSDRIGRAIGGLSRGGYWALEIAFRHTDLIRSVGGHSVALLDIAAGPSLNPQFTGLNNSVRELRIYLDIGRNDYVIANILTLHEDMVAAGIPHTWQLNDGSHEDTYWSANVADYIHWYGAEWPLERALYPKC